MSVLAPGAACHECGYTFDDAELLRDTCLVPGEGDVSICLACGAIAFYTAAPTGLTVRAPSAEERAELLQDQRIIDTLAAFQLMADSRPSWPKGPRA